MTQSEQISADTDHRFVVDVDAIACPQGYEMPAYFDLGDDVCLAYNGQIPGPTWVFHEGDRVELTLRHNVSRSLEKLDAPQSVASLLGDARYSLHRHGISQGACHDGVAQIVGTLMCDSTVGPSGGPDADGTVTYAFTTPFPGFWHYHDHSTGMNREVVQGPVLGHEAKWRGLWGSFLVLGEGESTDHVFDLHLLCRPGPNGGLGLNGTINAGVRFDIIVTSLCFPWTVTLEGPDGEPVGQVEVGEGVSRGITVQDAEPGTYRWTAEVRYGVLETYAAVLETAGQFERAGPFEGEVVVS